MGKAQLVTILQFWLSNHPRLLTTFLFDQTECSERCWIWTQTAQTSFFLLGKKKRFLLFFCFIITLFNIMEVRASKPLPVFTGEKYLSKPERTQQLWVSAVHLIIFYVNKLNKLWHFLWHSHINYLQRSEHLSQMSVQRDYVKKERKLSIFVYKAWRTQQSLHFVSVFCFFFSQTEMYLRQR